MEVAQRIRGHRERRAGGWVVLADGMLQADGEVGEVEGAQRIARTGKRGCCRRGFLRVTTLDPALDAGKPARCVIQVAIDDLRDTIRVIAKGVEQVVERFVVERDGPSRSSGHRPAGGPRRPHPGPSRPSPDRSLAHAA